MTEPLETALPVGVVGGGVWGLGLARAAAASGCNVLIRSRRKVADGDTLPRTESFAELATHAALVLLAVPSEVFREVARAVGEHLDGHHLLVHVVRGLLPAEGSEDPLALQTLSDVLRRETPVRRLGALGGPLRIAELGAGQPCLGVVASEFPDVLAIVRRALAGPRLRLCPSSDLVGLEWASSLTALVAIAIGFARGAGLGRGLVGAMISRAMSEAGEVIVAAGGRASTAHDLGGMGDVLAAFDDMSRVELRLGEALARGASLESALAALGERVPAVDIAPRVSAFARARGVHAPILLAIAEAEAHGWQQQALVNALMEGTFEPHDR